MIYAYDILVNWSTKKAFDFFEWENNDNIHNIKKIPLFLIQNGLISDLIDSKFKIKNNDLLKEIYNQTEYYSLRKIVIIPYALIITDGLEALAVTLDKNGEIKEKSKLLLDEEEEILCIASKLKKINLDVKIEKKYKGNNYQTRKELKIRDYLLKEIQDSYKKKEYSKIKYIYSEYCNESIDNIDKMYETLIESLNEEIKENHKKIYDLLLLSTYKI